MRRVYLDNNATSPLLPEVFEATLEDLDLDPDEVDDPRLPEAELPY